MNESTAAMFRVRAPSPAFARYPYPTVYFNKGALVAIPVAAVVIAVILNRDRIPLPDWVLYAGFVLFVIAAVAATISLASRRSRLLAAVAKDLDLTFHADPHADAFRAFQPDAQAAEEEAGAQRTELRQLDLFRGKIRPVTSNVMAGKLHGLDALVFDFAYRSGSTSNSYYIGQTVAAFRLPGRDLPAFVVSPQGLLHNLAAMVGYHDVNFDHHPDFSRRFVLKGETETAVRAAFTPRVLEAFEAAHDFHFTVEGRAEYLIVYDPNTKIGPAKAGAFAREAAAIAEAFRV